MRLAVDCHARRLFAHAPRTLHKLRHIDAGAPRRVGERADAQNLREVPPVIATGVDIRNRLDQPRCCRRRPDQRRIQLLAYGGEKGDKGSDARRLSLKRALAIRQVLIEDGVDARRIDVRAMGGADDGGPTDRVDVFVKA